MDQVSQGVDVSGLVCTPVGGDPVQRLGTLGALPGSEPAVQLGNGLVALIEVEHSEMTVPADAVDLVDAQSFDLALVPTEQDASELEAIASGGQRLAPHAGHADVVHGSGAGDQSLWAVGGRATTEELPMVVHGQLR
jgi:hypothetical protein